MSTAALSPSSLQVAHQPANVMAVLKPAAGYLDGLLPIGSVHWPLRVYCVSLRKEPAGSAAAGQALAVLRVAGICSAADGEHDARSAKWIISRPLS